MILVDTNIIIDFWKNPTKEAIAISGVTCSELIHGAKSEKEINLIIEALSEFHLITPDSKDWLEIGLFLNRLKKNRVSIPFQDAIIAFLCIKNNFELWTNDKHFKYVNKVISDLKIFSLSYM